MPPRKLGSLDAAGNDHPDEVDNADGLFNDLPQLSKAQIGSGGYNILRPQLSMEEKIRQTELRIAKHQEKLQ